MLKFSGCTFSAAGADKKAKVYGLTLTGTEETLIEDCSFNGTGYAALLNKSEGTVVIKNSVFECGNIYNPIEGTQTEDQGNLTVENCDFIGVPGNNFINFYRVADNTVHTIKNCKFRGASNNNIIRLSNRNDCSAIFNVENIDYDFVSGTPDEYSGMILCQDYTAKNGAPQNFSLYTVNLKNIKGPENVQYLYSYQDGEGIITGNRPALTIDGQPVVFGSGESMIEEDGDF